MHRPKPARRARAIIAAIAVVASAASVAAQYRGTPPLPIGDQGAWFPQDAYPASARRNGESGRVAVLLTLDAAGVPTGCTVRESTASETLNQVTCELAMRNARFNPRLDADGRGMPGTYQVGGVNWQTESVMAPRQRVATERTVSIAVSAANRFVSCVTLRDGRPVRGGRDDQCDAPPDNPDLFRLMKGHYAARAAVVTQQSIVWFPGDAPIAELHQVDGVEELALRRMRFRVLPDGSMTIPGTIEIGGAIPPPEDDDGDMLGRHVAMPGRSDEVMFLQAISVRPAD